MLALIWMLYFVFGMVSASIAPLVHMIKGDLNVSFTEMGMVLGAWQLGYVFVAPVVGTVVDRIGLRTTLGIGVFIMVASALLRSMADGFPTLFLSVLIFGAGGPTISIGSPKMVAMWFGTKERGLATGVYSTAPIIGTVLILASANSVLVPLTGGWRETYLLLGAITFLTAIVWWLFAREPQAPAAKTNADGSVQQRTPLKTILAEMLGHRNVQVILLLAIGTFVMSHGLQTWLPSLLQAGGMTPDEAGFWAAIPNLVGIVGLLLLPRIITHGQRGRLAVFLLVVWAFALVLLAQTTGPALIFSLLLLGFVNSCIMPTLMLLLMETPVVGPLRMGMAAGLYFCIAEIGGFGGPVMLGMVKDATGSLIGGVMFLALLSFLLAFPTLLIRETESEHT